MNEQWKELKETIVELRDSDGTGTQQEVCKFLANYMEVLEKQIQEPCEDEYVKVPKKALKYRTAGMVAYNAEWLRNHFDIERAVICGVQQPCEDAIGRSDMLDAIGHGTTYTSEELQRIIKGLPPVNPQNCDKCEVGNPCLYCKHEYEPWDRSSEELREVVNELKKYTAGKKNTQKTEISVLVLNRLIFALEEQEEKWIPVSEKVPEKSGEYLVSVIDSSGEDNDYEAVRVAWFAHKKNYDIKESEWRELGIDETGIAWMPLPKPYKAESEG